MDPLSFSLQENILILLIFDKDSSKLIRNSVSVSLFESAPYKEIASAAINFLDRFNEPPGEHIADLLESKLEGEDKRRSNLYSTILVNLYDSRNTINKEYIISQLSAFIRQQKLKQGIVEAAQIIQAEGVEGLDRAEEKIISSIDASLQLFNPGTFFASITNFNLIEKVECFPTGIKELDNRELGPTRKELHTFIAPAKRGKSWWLVHLAKHALLHRAKVCHISLEMSERRMVQRYIQSIFSISKRPQSFSHSYFELDEKNQLKGITFKNVSRPSFKDNEISNILKRNIEKLGSRLKLVVKEFPTGLLSIRELNVYLDILERQYNFIPDLLLIDYPDLMDLSGYGGELRHNLGNLMKQLRGLAVRRNMALVAPTQSNREGSVATLVTDYNVGEDYSKIATSDLVITYSQTQQERELGLARLFVANGRNDEDKFTILISQNYALGQFCLDSTMMSSTTYWKQIKSLTDPDKEDDLERA